MMMAKKIELPAEVAKEYELVDYPAGTGPEQLWPQGKVNVNELTLPQAARLEARGWPFLRKRKKEAAAKKTDDKK